MKKQKQKVKVKVKTKVGLAIPNPKGKARIDFAEDSRQSAQPQLLDIERVSSLAIQLQSKLLLIVQAEERLALLKQEAYRIKTEDLPALMDELNLSEIRLKDGGRLVVKPLIQASIPSEGAIRKTKDGHERMELKGRQMKCFTYLRKNGAGSLIKTQVEATFGKNSQALANKALAALARLGVKPEITTAVHPQTLNAWVRERLEGGKPVDMDLFRVFSGSIAEITTPNTEATF